jgi:hypothetical protein
MNPPKPILHETPEIDFKLCMNIIFKDGTGKSENVVYKGATASRFKHIIRRIDGTWSHVDQSHLSLINKNWIWKYSTNATQLLQRGRHWHFSGTSTAISLPQSLDSSTARINELASSPLSLAIQQNSHVGKAWILT